MSLTAATDSGSFTVGDHIVLSHVYTIISVDLANNTIQLRNPWGSDAGKQKGAWVYGLNDGYVTFNATEWSDKPWMTSAATALPGQTRCPWSS